jgi:flagellar basal-body rod modification protein FlgD
MQIEAIQGSSHVVQTAGRRLGKEAFLQLLIAQLRNQDPLQPMNDREFVAQLAQLSALEQMQNISSAISELTRRQEALAAFALVGRRVTVLDDAGKKVQGVVTAVRRHDNEIVLVVDGKEYTLDRLVEVTA